MKSNQRGWTSMTIAMIVLGGAIASPLSAEPGDVSKTTPTTMPTAFRNPLKEHGADPWLQYVDGWYYLATTTGRDVQLRRAKHIAELKDAKDQIVWRGESIEMQHGVWAPEFHRLESGNGPKWYLYVTAFDGKDDADHRMFVAESDSLMGPFVTKGKIKTDPKDAFYAIDGTVIQWPNGTNYFAWCGRPSPTGQGLYIAKMKNPWTIEGERTYLDADGFGCGHVREGPVTLVRNGRVFLTYSMCGADSPDYRIGMLIADANADPLKKASWTQHPKVLFARNDEARVYGPGHHFFFKSPDGKEDWIIYHAKTTQRLTYADRTARAQKIGWTAEGLPDLGKPLAESTEIAPPSGE